MNFFHHLQCFAGEDECRSAAHEMKLYEPREAIASKFALNLL